MVLRGSGTEIEHNTQVISWINVMLATLFPPCGYINAIRACCLTELLHVLEFTGFLSYSLDRSGVVLVGFWWLW